MAGKTGVNLQKNLIQDCLASGVFVQGQSCGLRMEHNLLLNCLTGVSIAQGSEIFAEGNSFTCKNGFVAKGVLRGFFKNNYMACQEAICSSDVPPSFVMDNNN